MDTLNEQYEDYFKLRNISNETYSEYKLPPYLPGRLPADKNARILDIGCGFAQMLFALKKLGYNSLHGIDVSSDAVAFCQKNGLDVTLVSGVDAYLAAEEEKYDFIIMSHVLEHIPKENAISTLAHIRRHILKDGGQFLVMVPNAQSHTGVYWMYEDFTHYTLFTAGSLMYVLRAAGFKNIALVDKDAIESATTWYGKLIRRVFLKIYNWKYDFWNKITHSSFHPPSPRVFTFDVKALAS